MSDDKVLHTRWGLTTGGSVEKAYGLYISIPAGMEAYLDSVKAKEKADVLIEWRGETKTFTFADFAARLDFPPDQGLTRMQPPTVLGSESEDAL